MSSRLKRLLYEPDTEDWKRYQRKWLLGNANLYGWLAIILLIAGVGHLVHSYLQINSQVPKGIPDEFYVVSLLSVHPLAEYLIAEDEQQVMLDRGEFEVYPHFSYRRYPSARLVYSLAGQGQPYNFDVDQEVDGFTLYVYNPLLEFALSPQFMDAPKLNDHDLPQMIDSVETLLVLQESWGDQVLLENKHIGWPGTLSVNNLSAEGGDIHLEWQLCYWVGLVAPGEQVCSPIIISSGTQLASP